MEYLAAYLARFGQIFRAFSNDLYPEWSFKLDRNAFIAVHICLDVAGQKMPVIVTDRAGSVEKLVTPLDFWSPPS